MVIAKRTLIASLAYRFRMAIEKTGVDLFYNFPKGCCGEASKLLYKYLSDNGIETEYVWGLKGEQSHGWLEYESLVIDITADQFPDISKKVIVTYDRSWYSSFEHQDKYKDIDFDNFNYIAQKKYRDKYNKIMMGI